MPGQGRCFEKNCKMRGTFLDFTPSDLRNTFVLRLRKMGYFRENLGATFAFFMRVLTFAQVDEPKNEKWGNFISI